MTSKKTNFKYRRTLILIYLITAIILIPLIFISQSNVPVKITLSATRVVFDFIRSGKDEESEGGSFFSSLFVDEIRFKACEKFIIPFEKAEIGSEVHEKTTHFPEAGANGKLTIIPSLGSKPSVVFKKIRLNELYIQKGAQVTLSVPNHQGAKPRTINIRIERRLTEGKIIIPKFLSIECQYCDFGGIDGTDKAMLKFLDITISTKSFEIIDFQSRKDRLFISMELPEGNNLSEEDIYLEKISFLEKIRGELKSSLSGKGEVVFEDSNKKIEINHDDLIKIDKFENFRITRMTFENGGIGLTLRGYVSELKVGTAYTKEKLASKLPSILEWIYNKQALALYLAALMLIAPAIIAVLEKLKITNK